MKLDRFVAGQLWIERTKQREGPPFVYTCWSGRTSRLFTDQKALLKFVKWPSKTPTGDYLRQWLLSFEKGSVVVEVEAEDKSSETDSCV